MKSNKVYVEKPSSDDANKKEGKKKKPGKKDIITISKNPNPAANENITYTPAGNKTDKGPGSEITDGEDG